MSLIDFLILLVIAAIFGGLGQSISGYSFGGCFVSIIVGFVGAFLGKWLIREFNLPIIFEIHMGGRSYPIIWSIIGAAILSFALGVISKGMKSEN
ncbi:MAG: GlsB/YeaQ/YmgE family stress response membrane protein [Ignavibacteria bacterium]|jgi:uncharacterized membrane protein YeaQ/YmgE (transglycosylase-associated protein family)